MRNLRTDLARQRTDFLSKLKDATEGPQGHHRRGRLPLAADQLDDDHVIMQGSTDGSPDSSMAAMVSLTETLLQRQSALEAVTSERTALALQLERLEVGI